MEKTKYHDIFDQTPQYLYPNDIVGLTLGAFTVFVSDIFD